MSQDGQGSDWRSLSPEGHKQYRIAGYAYIPTVLGPLVVIAVLGWVASLNHQLAWVAAALVALVVAVAVYRVMNLRSVTLWHDDSGVWLKSGILPWSRGVSGIKWRDIEDARFTQNFSSWLLKAYTVQVNNRFTRAREIDLPAVSRGDQAVMEINGRLRTMVDNRAG